MSLDELREHVKEQYGAEGMRELPERLARVEAKGTSGHDDRSAVDAMWLNRAGAGESVLTYDEIVQMYCKRSGDIVGHKHDYSSAATDCSRDECWSPELFDDRRSP
jgi:hypothetical protein